MHEEKLYQLALTLVPGLGDILTKTLISYVGGAKAVFNHPVNKLNKIPGIGPNLARAIKNFDLTVAKDHLKKLEAKNVKLYFYTDKEYPNRLKQIYDAPALLYFSGNLNLNHTRMLAIVGTRNASEHGKQFVRDFIKDLAGHNLVIVSGLAYGIDIEAHIAALKYNIPTVGVIASGLDIIYPSIHAKYAKKMINNGGLVTEYPLETKLDPARFPARNRIIAGMADATVVVEAAEKGGALITADLAAGYDREVFAVPGRWNDLYSVGCNKIINNNLAQSITSAEDLQYYMQWPAEDEKTEIKPTLIKDDFDDQEWVVINTIENSDNEIHIDELSWKSQIQIGKLATILLNLEFKGIVNSIPGKKYSLN
ncbi:MAG: DNA-processing protein DprA [Bacteroidota bacterium]